MAEFNRSLSIPVEVRTRSRHTHATCPRCRIDPGHISRQIWERPPAQETRTIITDVLPSSSRRSGRSHTAPVHTYQNVREVLATPTPLSSTNTYYNTNSGLVRYSANDGHSTRSAGDTWRIRGILENHQQQPDVTRRAESRLPDVTQHSATIQHVRTRSVPVGGTYDARVPSSSLYDIHLHQQHTHQHQLHSVSRSSTQGVLCPRNQVDVISSVPHPVVNNSSQLMSASNPIIRHHEPSIIRQELSIARQEPSIARQEPSITRQEPSITRQEPSITRQEPSITRQEPSITRQEPSWKREQQHSANSPWVTRTVIPSGQQPQASACWRPSTVSSGGQNVMNQCPLPDLITPRRQARKQCCGLLAAHSVAIRWIVVAIAALGLICAVIGTIVGVIKATGKEHLTVSLLLIGLGLVLVSMSGVAWRLTSRDSPSCRAMFGLRRARHEQHRRFVPRVPHYGRPHPFSAMLYPDITLRPPPPSYQASMQEYRLRLLLMDRTDAPTTSPPPPPVYRGPTTVYPRFPANPALTDYSRPPSYRSRPPSSAGQPSPVGHEDVDLINNPPTSSSHHDTLPRRPAPSSGPNTNHVEVVAQV